MNSIMATIPSSAALAPIDQSALARLREKARMDAATTVWRPSPGDTIEGIIIGSRKVEGPFGTQQQCLVQTPDGSITAVWLTDWLLGQLRANAAELGDMLSLTFIGKETGARGQSFNRMSVTILKP